MALASRHNLHSLAAPSPILRRGGGFNRYPGKNHVAIARNLVVRAKKLESSPTSSSSSSSSSSSGKTSKLDSSKAAVTNQSQAPASSPPPSTTPSPSDEYFDPGMVPDFWEGEQWNWLGFILKYLWAIGIVVAIITCGILFVTYKPREIDYRYREAPTLEEVKKILDERRNPMVDDEIQEQEAPAVAQEEPEMKAEVAEPEMKAEVAEPEMKAEVAEPEMEAEVVETGSTAIAN